MKNIICGKISNLVAKSRHYINIRADDSKTLGNLSLVISRGSTTALDSHLRKA